MAHAKAFAYFTGIRGRAMFMTGGCTRTTRASRAVWIPQFQSQACHAKALFVEQNGRKGAVHAPAHRNYDSLASHYPTRSPELIHLGSSKIVRISLKMPRLGKDTDVSSDGQLPDCGHWNGSRGAPRPRRSGRVILLSHRGKTVRGAQPAGLAREAFPCHQWRHRQGIRVTTLPVDTNPYFSFKLGGARSRDLLPSWRFDTETMRRDDGLEIVSTWADEPSGICAIQHLRRFDDIPGVEVVLRLENRSTVKSPVVSEILPLDTRLPADAGQKTFLHHTKGSDARWDDFLPLVDELWEGRDFALAPVGGRSSDSALPFMNLQLGAGGVVIAIGWTGQWMARFRREGAGIHVAAGMERTHISLEPGETVRTPRILLIPWEGEDRYVGNNLLRKAILAHYTPRKQPDGEPVLPPVSHMTMSTYHRTGKVTLEDELDALERAKELGCEAYWIDACWFGTGNWGGETGQWTIRKDVFPDGLAPVGKAAARSGMGFVLWFEPERVCVGTEIERDHPEFVLRGGPNPNFCLLNLGYAPAREFICDRISSIIADSGVTIYRQDFNFQPLPYWRAADPPDRIGVSEIRHIEGLYWLWDELRRRHPGLAIDNCASGGRRIDLETTMRSFPLWRSDFSDVGGPAYGRMLQIACQIQTAGLSQWVPIHSAAVWTYSPYDFRSAMSTGVTLYNSITAPDFPADDAKKAIQELKRIRRFLLADYFPLVPVSFATHDWCAYQYHLAEESAGIAVFLRRHESPFPLMDTRLRAIDCSADYEVTMSPGFERGAVREMRGEDLSRICVQIPETPGSLLVEYRKIQGRGGVR